MVLLAGPELAEILMVNLERSLVSKLNVYLNSWRRYVDDTIVFSKIGYVEYLLCVLNILLYRDVHDIITTVYRKMTNNDVYLNWYSFCPKEWKRGTLRSMVELAYITCSSSHLLKEELKHLEKVFVMKNNLPIWVVKKILKEEKEKLDNTKNADKSKLAVQTGKKFESENKT